MYRSGAAMRIYIKYQDGTGAISEREISDACRDTDAAISAFCHMRNERRSFNLDRIMHSVAVDTGELLNPYQLVPLMRDPESLDSLTWKFRQAVKALKFFCLTTRGFSKRERQHVNKFVRGLVSLPHSDEEINDWAYKLWCADLYWYRDGDVGEYKGLLEHIPSSLLEECQAYAVKIVGGSASKPENVEWMPRLEDEFKINPIVRKPPLVARE
jgi:hypothetical protein